MTAISPPPIYEIVSDKDTGKMTLPWILFMNQVFTGDAGTPWIPTITGLTISGTPVITGIYYQIGALAYFTILIIPATSTTSVSGTTYCNNFPLTMKSSAPSTATTNAPSASLSVCDSLTNRIYFPSWSAITSEVTISGWIPAS